MKRIALIAAAATLAATGANAADLYKGGGSPAAYAPAPVAPAYSWTGFYLGGNVGGDWASIGESDSIRYSDRGIAGGGQVGYNYQTGSSLVLGIESDFGIVTANAIDESAFLADVTGRLGVASGAGLFYIKGGWAYLDTENFDAFDGWTLGGGIEYFVTPSWSIKGEYQHFDLTGDKLRDDFNLEIDTVKVGINYHFGAGGYIPLK